MQPNTTSSLSEALRQRMDIPNRAVFEPHALFEAPTVFVIDNDADTRSALQCLFEMAGLPVEIFDSAEAFLLANRIGLAGCLLLEERLPGISGLQLVKRLRNQALAPPVIFHTARVDISAVWLAAKAGATDFLLKPAHAELILEAVYKAFAVNHRQHGKAAAQRYYQNLLALLTNREREVFLQLATGGSSTVIAQRLGIRRRTLEVHRHHIVKKLGTRNLTELIIPMVRLGLV